jgi:hypothetical protein
MKRGWALEREMARYERHLQQLLDRPVGTSLDEMPF